MDDIMNAELTDILKANNIEIPVSGGGGLQSIGPGMYPVSYTHLTLPTN